MSNYQRWSEMMKNKFSGYSLDSNNIMLSEDAKTLSMTKLKEIYLSNNLKDEKVMKIEKQLSNKQSFFLDER